MKKRNLRLCQKAIITDLLKGEMGFNGVVTTDAMNMKAIADTFGESQAVKLLRLKQVLI